MLPLGPWKQTPGLLLDFPAGLRQGRRGGREQHTVSGGLIDSGCPLGGPNYKGFMLSLTEQQIEIYMELTAD